MVISYLLFMCPLTTSSSLLNTIWFGVMLCAFYSFYTLTMLTFYATFSEVCETERDTVFISNAKSICDVVYFSLGYALIPVFISLGINIRIVALIFLPLSLSMLIPFFLLKENDDSGKDSTRGNELNLRDANSKLFAFASLKYLIIQSSAPNLITYTKT